MSLVVKQIVTGQWHANCYAVSDEKHNCLLIDPGDDLQKILQYIESVGLTLKAIAGTHGHFDHIGAASELKERFNSPLYLHHADNKHLKYANLYKGAFDSIKKINVPHVDFDLAGTGYREIGSFLLEVIETPGHS